MKVLWLLPITLVIDQASKYLVTSTMSLHDSEPVLGNFFRLTYIHNPGAAFGLNIGSPLVHTIVSIVALSILVYLFWTMPRENRLLRFALTLVLGGALGNIIDRLYLGEVIDFFDFGIATLRNRLLIVPAPNIEAFFRRQICHVSRSGQSPAS